jgi:hypothetical protein
MIIEIKNFSRDEVDIILEKLNILEINYELKSDNICIKEDVSKYLQAIILDFSRSL